MTTTQKILVTTTVMLAVSAAVYEWHRASEMESEIHLLRGQQASSTHQIERLQRERDELSNRAAFLADESASLKDDAAQLSRLREEVAQSNASVQGDAAQSAAKSWLERVTDLKQRLEETPDAKIPELQFVTEQDWLDAAKRELKTEADYRRALSAIRGAGEGKVAAKLQKALAAYMRGSNGQFPTDLSQLQPFFDSPMDDAILQRWEIVPAKTVENVKMGGDVSITQTAPVDDVFDWRIVIGPNGWGSTDFLSLTTRETMNPVWEAYRAAHGGEWPNDPSQLQPYVTTPEQRAALEKLTLRESTSK
jgi:hypothetical protein